MDYYGIIKVTVQRSKENDKLLFAKQMKILQNDEGILELTTMQSIKFIFNPTLASDMG